MKKLFIATILATLFLSCSNKITATITKVNGDTVQTNKGYSFRIKKAALPKLGDKVTFKGTYNKKKVNSFLIKK